MNYLITTIKIEQTNRHTASYKLYICILMLAGIKQVQVGVDHPLYYYGKSNGKLCYINHSEFVRPLK